MSISIAGNAIYPINIMPLWRRVGLSPNPLSYQVETMRAVRFVGRGGRYCPLLPITNVKHTAVRSLVGKTDWSKRRPRSGWQNIRRTIISWNCLL